MLTAIDLEIKGHILMDYKFLKPLTLPNGTILRNRIVMAPTTLDSSFYDGHISKDEVDYYSLRSSGPGMIIVEAAFINSLGQGFPGQISISNDDLIPSLSKVAHAITNNGSKAVLQLHHAGRLTNHQLLGDSQPVAPSAIKDPNGGELPRELTALEVEQIIDDYAQATRRAILAGFSGIEIHGANRFLPQQFFSRQANHRTDKWGDKFAFPVALIKKISDIVDEHATPDFIIGYRMSPEETYEDGYHYNEAIELAQELTKDGRLDYIHLSQFNAVGTPLVDKVVKQPLVTMFRESLPKNVALITVGGVRNPQQANDALDAGAELVAMGIQLIIEPKWVEKHANNEESSVSYVLSPTDYEALQIPEPAIRMWIEGALKQFVRFAKNES